MRIRNAKQKYIYRCYTSTPYTHEEIALPSNYPAAADAGAVAR